jgi:hypothetical protein
MPFEGMNVTGVSGVGSSSLWFPLLIVTIILVAGIIALVLSSFSRYKKLRGFFGFLGKSFGYFGKGLVAISIFGALYLGILVLGMGIAEGTIDLFGFIWAASICIGAFFGIAGIGYIFDKLVWKRIMTFNKRYKKEKT